MIADRRRQMRPGFDLRHYSPKTKRPSSSPSCLDSIGSFEARKRSASSKKAFSFCLLASIPNSINSTRTRLSLSRRRLAIDSTCLASGFGRVTLRRTCFVIAMAPLYTVMVQRGVIRDAEFRPARWDTLYRTYFLNCCAKRKRPHSRPPQHSVKVSLIILPSQHVIKSFRKENLAPSPGSPIMERLREHLLKTWT